MISSWPLTEREDDLHVGDFADLLHQLHAVAARKHQVQQNQTWLFLRHEPGDLLRVAGYDRRVAPPSLGRRGRT